MKKQLSIVLALVLLITSLLTIPASAKSADQFSDVAPGHWYYSAVDHVVKAGLFGGTSTTVFSPNIPMTRGMFITVLGRLHGVSTSYTSSTGFSDVRRGEYYYPHTAWAKDNKIVTGSTFSPSQPITREDMALYFYRYFDQFGFGIVGRPDKYSKFPDTEKVSPGAVQAMKWATKYGIINGSSGKLDPKGFGTRAQVAQIFLNFSGMDQYALPELHPEYPWDSTSEPTVTPSPTQKPSWENYHPIYELPTGRTDKDIDGGYYDYNLSNEIARQINVIRKDRGLRELNFHPLVQSWADIRAKECNTLYSHTRPDGTNCDTVGLFISMENLNFGLGYPQYFIDDTENCAERIVNAWYNSYFHQQNMLNPSGEVAAVSCYIVGKKVYAVHLFSKRPLYFYDYDVYDIYGWPRS